tara:strand:+ start:24992 stop:25636 length:645 start_codon:yes stop_codon:yes gene_type:complete
MLKGSNKFVLNYHHNFADLRKDKSICIIDDVPASFKHDALYTNIVAGIIFQIKGTAAIEIPFEKAPEFVIPTNWAVRYNEEYTSTSTCFCEYKLTDFFNLNNTPIDVFEHTLCEDRDKLEWSSFYSFAYKCVSMYLVDGLQRIPYDTSEVNYWYDLNNDSMLHEFERVLRLMTFNFIAKDFIEIYLRYDKHPKVLAKLDKRSILIFVSHEESHI